MTDAIEWQSDGPVLTLADGTKVRPVIAEPFGSDRHIPFEIDTTDEWAVYGPEVDNASVSVWFEELDA